MAMTADIVRGAAEILSVTAAARLAEYYWGLHEDYRDMYHSDAGHRGHFTLSERYREWSSIYAARADELREKRGERNG